MIAGSNQPGPTESGSGKAQYTPAAASIATNAGQRGSRVIGLLMAMWRSTRVESNTVSLRLKRMWGTTGLPRRGRGKRQPRDAGPCCARFAGVGFWVTLNLAGTLQPAPETHRKEVLLCLP